MMMVITAHSSLGDILDGLAESILRLIILPHVPLNATLQRKVTPVCELDDKVTEQVASDSDSRFVASATDRAKRAVYSQRIRYA
jgi:hypothetical protein